MKRVQVLLVLFVCSCGGGGVQIPRDKAVDPGELIFNGYTKPEIKCFECHNGNGAGTKYGPALKTRLPNLTDVQMRTSILDGKDEMPSFRGKLTDAELDQVTAWLRKSFGGPPVTAPPPAPAGTGA